MESFHGHYCSTLDSIWPPVIQRWILCFPSNKDKKTQTSILLQNSFAMTLQQKPFLAGVLKREDVGPKAGRFKVIYSDAEAQKSNTRFWTKDLTEDPSVWPHTYLSLREEGMPVSRMVSNVLGPPITLEELATLPMGAQANLIPGGCLLYICLNHSMFDGSGAAMMIGAWAENCRILQQYANFQPVTGPIANPSYEGFTLPALLQDDSTPHNEEIEGILQETLLWQLLGLCRSPVWRSASALPPSSKPLISAIFTAPKETIDRLKDSCISYDADAQTRGVVTPFEATAALLWRCIMRARCADLRQPERSETRLRIPVNVRKAFEVPPSYPGNVLLNSNTEMALTSLVTELDKCHIASMIHSSICLSRSPDFAPDAVKLSFVLPEPNLRYPLFQTTTAEDLVLTSWQNLPLLEQTWGPAFGPTGQAEFLRIPHGNLPGICALLPRKNEGDVDVLVSLQKEHLDRLIADSEFTHYFKLQST